MKLGCLPYLNVKPLVYPFEHGDLPTGWELVYAPPLELAEMLARGEIAVAPVSSFATFVYSEFDICPGICIAAHGPVQSVLMLSRKPIDDIRTVALDTSSLSGANMLKIVLDEAHGVRPDFIRLAPNAVSQMLERADAALVIGNPAMTCPKDGLIAFDLADEWVKLTGVPAVFAVWAGLGVTGEIIAALHDAKKRGTAKIEEIAREESAKMGLSYEVCRNYLREVMVYDMGEQEELGLQMFREKAFAHGLIDAMEPAKR